MSPNQPNFGNVVLPENFTEKELRWSSWWVEHQEGLRKTAIGFFIAIDAFLMLFGIWGFIDFLALGGVKEEQAIRRLISGYALMPAAPPKEVSVSEPTIFSIGADRYDIVTPIENPNEDFWVELVYRFVGDKVETPERKAFILPLQAKFLYEFGVKGGRPDQIEITRRSFHRFDRHEIPDYEKWATPRLAIETIDPHYKAPETGASTPVSSAQFGLENKTPYSYYDVGVLVLLYRGDSYVAANKVRVDRLRAGEKRGFELFWYQNLPQVTRVEVLPEINIFDPKAYKQPGT